MALSESKVADQRLSPSDPEFVSFMKKVMEMLDDPFEIGPPCSPAFQALTEDESSTPSSKASEDSTGSTEGSSVTTTSGFELSPSGSLDASTDSTRQTHEPSFDDLLRDDRTSPGLADRFKRLRDLTFHISLLLFPNGMYTVEDKISESQNHVYSMQKWLAAYHNAIRERVDNITFITSLAPFTIAPPRKYFWVCYKQRAELIVRHVARCATSTQHPY